MTTEGSICLLTMELLGMDSKLSRPTKAPSHIEQGSVEEKQSYIRNVSETVVDALWHDIDTSKLLGSFSELPAYKYCICHEDRGDGEPMIGCEKGEEYVGDEWYHWKCLGMKKQDVPKDDWYCDACKKI